MTMAEFAELEREDALAEQQAAAMRERVLEADRCIRLAWRKMSKRSMEIGYEGAYLKRLDAWKLLGYENEHHYRNSVGIGRSTWYDMVKIAEAFPELDKETYLSMSAENARRLALEPKEIRYAPEMLAKAAKQRAQDFKDELTTDGAIRAGRSVKEHWTTMEWLMTEHQRAAIEEGVREWRQEHGIESEVFALEMMVAEYRDRPTLVGFMAESIPRLTRALTEARSPEDLAELRGLVAQHVREMGEILRVCCGEPGAEEEQEEW